MAILVVEDDAAIAGAIRRGLESSRYSVEVASDGEAGLDRALTGSFDLIILDLMLPGRDGWSICETLRGRGDRTPILMLTARDAVGDRVKGLELGADDYLPKPFDFSELLARVAVLLRRGEERNQERRRREQVERTLRALNQSIGGVVHDLGNPLTSVQFGVETLEAVLQEGSAAPELLHELTTTIEDGAQMLAYLRLALLDQTRILEGQPLPIEVKPVSLRPIVEAGARYQKITASSRRKVSLDGPDVTVTVDPMRMTTVFMNLMGNALKYSDGEVTVTWRTHAGKLLAAVVDRGKAGRGITREQAGRLFTPFGRLEAHAGVEGTGLGLLSALKTVQAHGGEIYVEGYEDGSPESGRFSTAGGEYPSVLSGDALTAFVVLLPHLSSQK